MISYKRGKKRFKYRVAGVMIHGGRVLLHQLENSTFWSLPGGRGELLESSTETLKREMAEELGIEIEIGRLIWITENFYKSGGKLVHEIAFYYTMTSGSDSAIYQKKKALIGYEGDERLIFRWYPLDELKQLNIYPQFLRKGLLDMPQGIEHIIIRGV